MGDGVKEKKTRKRHTRLTAEGWLLARGDFEAGDPCAVIAERYDVCPSTVQAHKLKEGWVQAKPVRPAPALPAGPVEDGTLGSEARRVAGEAVRELRAGRSVQAGAKLKLAELLLRLDARLSGVEDAAGASGGGKGRRAPAFSPEPERDIEALMAAAFGVDA